MKRAILALDETNRLKAAIQAEPGKTKTQKLRNIFERGMRCKEDTLRKRLKNVENSRDTYRLVVFTLVLTSISLGLALFLG